MIHNLVAKKPAKAEQFSPFARRARPKPPVEKMSPKKSFDLFAGMIVRNPRGR